MNNNNESNICLICGDDRILGTVFCSQDQNGTLGNCGDLHTFRLSSLDARKLELDKKIAASLLIAKSLPDGNFDRYEPCGRCALGFIEVGCLYIH